MHPALRSNAAFSLALLMLTALIYWPGLSGGFIFDDIPNIVANESIHATDISWTTLKQAASAYAPGSYGRPLATITFAINHLLGGLDPWGYKLAGLLIHLGNALLVFWLIRRILALPRSSGPWGDAAPFAIALVWAIHPLQASSVLYVVQRMETLSLTFVLLALLCYLRGRLTQQRGSPGAGWLVGSALLAGIGMLSKETALIFPLYALSLELTVLRFDADSAHTRRTLKWMYVVGTVLALAAYVVVVVPKYAAAEVFAGRDFTVYERVLTQCRVLPMYLGQILLPLPRALWFYYDGYSKSAGWLSPTTTLMGAIFLVALLIAGWRVRSRWPLVALGIFWFFAAHSLTSNVLNLELVFEHRNYFALLGVILALAELIRRTPVQGAKTKPLLICVLMIFVGFLALLRSATWGDPIQLAMAATSSNPDSVRARIELASQYQARANANPHGSYGELARTTYQEAASMPDSPPLGEEGLILIAAASAQPPSDATWQALIAKVAAHPTRMEEVEIVIELLRYRERGVSLDDRRIAEAYSIIARRNTLPAYLYARFGDHALNMLHDEQLAKELFIMAVRRDANDDALALEIIATLTSQGHGELAHAIQAEATVR